MRVLIENGLRFHLKQVESAAASSTPLQYRAKRSHPGAGIYRGANEVRLVLQIHDELVYEVREEISVEVAALVKVCMECAATLRVPLEAKVRVGPSWGELSALEIDKQVLEEMRQDILDIRPPLHPSLLGSASHGAAGGVGVAKNLFGLEDT